MSSAPATTKRLPAEFTGEESLRKYCNEAAARLEDLALDLSIAAVQTQKALEQMPDGLLGLGSKVRARLVTAHLRSGVKVLYTSASLVNGCWLSYCERFAEERKR